MATIGITTPAQVVNAFGLDTPSIAKSFAKMGKSHVLDPQGYEENARLIVFARGQILRSKMVPESKPTSWYQLKKKSRYNRDFIRWLPRNRDKYQTHAYSKNTLIIAHHILSEIRKIVRKWIRNDACNVQSSTSKPSSTSTQSNPSSQGLENIMKAFGALESRMDEHVEHVTSTVKAIPQTIKKQVDSVIKTKGNSSETPRSATKIRKKLEQELMKSSLAFPVQSEEEDSDLESSSSHQASAMEEQTSDEEKFPLPPLLPKTSKKAKP